jgi:pimeloyl-ACP methyl ester carboxylesterase
MVGGDRVVEKAVAFGPNRSLVGVWTTPGNDASGAPRPAVLLLNSGVIHHAGIWRLHVRLARALAADGFPSLRFDLSGIGDSERREVAATIEENVAKDVDDALTHVRDDRGISETVLLGLCSGARDSLEAAERDSRVVGVVAIDLVADLLTRQHYMAHFGRRLLSAESWRNTVTGRNGLMRRLLDALRGRSAPRSQGMNQAVVGLRDTMSRQYLSEIASTLLERDAKLLYLFSGGLEYNYNHRSQFREAVPDLAGHPNLTYDYFPQADHTFSCLAEQTALIARISQWMTTAFSAAASEVARTSAGQR